MRQSAPKTFSKLLQAWREGDKEAGNQLAILAYQDLHRLARQYLCQERNVWSLQPTELLSELFVRLLGGKEIEITDRAHFFSLSARLMRRILIDRARSLQAEKRLSPDAQRSLDEALHVTIQERNVNLIALDEVLSALEAISPRSAQMVDLHYFAGFTEEETAELLGISRATLRRDWSYARLWLYDQINGNGSKPG